MQVVYQIQGREFEWDSEKAESNILKHGVTFQEGAEVFFDPFYRTGDASLDEDEEVRDFIIGYSFSNRLLLAVYIERVQRTRMISVRPVTRTERKKYEDAS
ncbi:MAG: membrane protein [Chloroflexota bacterium]|nr:MAG: membrane protein [Chloroflexota bacterium]